MPTSWGTIFYIRARTAFFLDRCTLLKTSRYEDEADLFATCLLAPWPDDVLFEGETMDDLATRIGVRREVAEMYLNEVRRQ